MRFQLLPDAEDFERTKWILSSETRDDAEAQVLSGWRQVCALAQVRALLLRNGCSVTPESLEAWPLGTCKFALCGLLLLLGCWVAKLRFTKKVSGMNSRNVKILLKVYDRLCNVPGIDDYFRHLSAIMHFVIVSFMHPAVSTCDQAQASWMTCLDLRMCWP